MHNSKLKFGLAFATATLLLSACGGPETPVDPPIQNSAGVIQGQISPWTTGWANSVKPVNAAIETPGADFTAAVRSNGGFDLTLPGAGAMNSTYAGDLMTVKNAFAGCSVLSTTAPDALKIAQINELVTDTNKSIVASSNGGINFKLWWYATQDATFTLSGSDCIGIGSTNSTLALKQGWNVVDQTTATAGGQNVTTYTVVAPPTERVTWSPGASALSMQGLSPNVLRPWVKAFNTQ